MRTMDFRDTHCIWCNRRKAPIEECMGCPKYRKYHCGENLTFTDQLFCSVCVYNNSDELDVYCTTNRRLQKDNDEPFECYKFDFIGKTKK